MTAGWCSRMLRAALFAAVCVLLAALGHVLMSGTDVPAWALAAGAAVTCGAGWCLAGRERGLPLVVTVVVVAQTALHSAFSFAQSASAGPAAPVPAADSMTATSSTASTPSSTMLMDMGAPHAHAHPIAATHTHHATEAMNAMDTADAVGAMDAMDIGPLGMGHAMAGSSSYGMFAAHLLAALLCGLWLAYGEKAAFRILRAVAGWLAAPLRLFFALPVTPERPRVRARRRRSERAPRLLLVHAITSRGPPVGTAVA
ncbi:hypothetical protein ACWC10_13865 [Streptomyces sp. NPDC001595]|uniref:hypothetical protein n=1 Tax=Streptomyces sp. NPDC001532 TaxID=3154520 RepID=UPI00332C9E76